MEKSELIKKYLNKKVHVVIDDPYHPIDAVGEVILVDDAGQLHGTWGSLAAIPGVDRIDVVQIVGATISVPLSVSSTMYVQDENGYIYRIAEGTGDNLEREDIDAGYVDYIYYDVYEDLESLRDGEDGMDGGIILLKTPYAEMTVATILDTVADFCGVTLQGLVQ